MRAYARILAYLLAVLTALFMIVVFWLTPIYIEQVSKSGATEASIPSPMLALIQLYGALRGSEPYFALELVVVLLAVIGLAPVEPEIKT